MAIPLRNYAALYYNRRMKKATAEEIRRRFDADVERFSSLETGQAAAIDSPLALDLIAAAAAAVNPGATALLDIGCGAGNYTLKLLEALPHLEVTLVDLSRPMLDRARQRIAAAGGRVTESLQGDIRDVPLTESAYDIVLAAAVFHHLREEAEWRAVFEKIHRSLKTGGSLWVFDLVDHATPAVQALMWRRYGDYLASLKGEDYRRHVFGYIDREDTPRPLIWQLDRLRAAGFSQVEVLHKNGCFAAFGAIK